MTRQTANDAERITLAHGGGGERTGELIEQVILPALGGQRAEALTDAAVLEPAAGRLAVTTDSYVVQPLEFPGGDIGSLAVFGTANDLAVVGARPLGMTLGLVLQEGLPVDLLRRVLDSAGQAARRVGVQIVTGDTKVVQRDACDGMVINTSAVGQVHPRAQLGFERVAAGDEVVLSGPLGEHALAVMSRREGLRFQVELQSDSRPIGEFVEPLLGQLGADVHFMRDPTRGGLAATLAELSRSARVEIEIEQSRIPVNRTARVAAEMLGLDLLAAANEGKLVAVVACGAGERAGEVLRKETGGENASVIGTVTRRSDTPLVEMLTDAGGRRVVQMPYGEELPRIC